MYSITIDSKVLDYNYKKLDDFTYAFYVGDIYIGQVFRMKKYWTAVSGKPCDICPVEGFKNRLYASQFLLKLEGYI